MRRENSNPLGGCPGGRAFAANGDSGEAQLFDYVAVESWKKQRGSSSWPNKFQLLPSASRVLTEMSPGDKWMGGVLRMHVARLSGLQVTAFLNALLTLMEIHQARAGL